MLRIRAIRYRRDSAPFALVPLILLVTGSLPLGEVAAQGYTTARCDVVSARHMVFDCILNQFCVRLETENLHHPVLVEGHGAWF